MALFNCPKCFKTIGELPERGERVAADIADRERLRNRLVDLRRKMLEANVEIEQLLRSGRSSA